MEPQASKLGINILIIVSIILIAGSLFVTSTKQEVVAPAAEKSTEEIVEATTTAETIPAAIDDTNTEKQNIDQATTTASSTNQSILGKTWKWSTKANDTSKKSDAFTLTFSEDGKVNGKTDCNSFFGTYTIEGSKISFGPLGATRMFCENSSEGEFLALLEKVTAHSFDTNKSLTLTSGTTTMVFK